MTKTLNIEQILIEFLQVNQDTYSKLEQLDKVVESVEIVIVPIERRMFVRVREHVNNSLQIHQKDQNLVMREINFDTHLKNTMSPGARMRYADARNLDPQTIEKILENDNNG